MCCTVSSVPPFCKHYTTRHAASGASKDSTVFRDRSMVLGGDVSGLSCGVSCLCDTNGTLMEGRYGHVAV